MNQLVPLTAGVPAHLAALAPQDKSAFLAGIPAGGPALPSLSIRGKAFRLRKDGQEESLKTAQLRVILINSRPAASKRYYEGTYNREKLSAPRCWSIDGVTPQASSPVSPSCATCPMNAWGSRGDGTQAKACSDYKRTVVIPFGANDQNYGPAVLDLSATSLKTPKGADPREMQLREYVNMLASYGRSPSMVVTVLSFTEDEFPRVCFTYERDINAEEAKMVINYNASKDVLATIEGVDEHDEGAVTPAAPIPAPALAVPPAAHLQGLAAPLPPAAAPAVPPAPTAAPVVAPAPATVAVPAEAPAPAKRGRKPKAEAEPTMLDIPAHMAVGAPVAPVPAAPAVPAAPSADTDLEALLAQMGF